MKLWAWAVNKKLRKGQAERVQKSIGKCQVSFAGNHFIVTAHENSQSTLKKYQCSEGPGQMCFVLSCFFFFFFLVFCSPNDSYDLIRISILHDLPPKLFSSQFFSDEQNYQINSFISSIIKLNIKGETKKITEI